MKLMGQVIFRESNTELKQVAFHRGDVDVPETAAYVRRRGRPKQNWTEQLSSMMRQAAGSLKEWNRIVSSLPAWTEAVERLLE